MGKKIAFLHTVPTLVTPFNELSKELLTADVEIFHVADDMLLKLVLAQGGLSPFIYQRVAEHIVAFERAGIQVVQVTCSSISPCAEAARSQVGIPVLKIDEPMVDKALSLGTRIGIAATAPTTLKPTTDLVHERAKFYGKVVQVDSVLCEGAYKALFSGDTETHDTIVRRYLSDLLARCDVVILAQASMARVAATIPETEQTKPILSSPRMAVERLRDILVEIN